MLIVVAKCLSILHIFYQARKLKLLNSGWLFIACGLIGLTVCLNLSVVASLIASNLNGDYDLFSILPILLMVTELDFAHALLVMTVKSLSSPDRSRDDHFFKTIFLEAMFLKNMIIFK